MKQTATTMLMICLTWLNGYCQDSIPLERSISVQYFGELGLHPGIELDYGINLLNKVRPKESRRLLHQINFRSSIGYYHLPKYTNNLFITPSINYHFRSVNLQSGKYYFTEPYLKLGYMRYRYIGEVYITTDSGFDVRKISGGNAFVFGSGLNFGASIKPNKLDLLFGFEYLAELAEGGLLINHINFKLGVRYQLSNYE